MIYLAITLILLIVDLVMFIDDRYIASAVWTATIIGAGLYAFPPALVALSEYSVFMLIGGWLVAGSITALVKWIAALVGHSMRIRSARDQFNKKYPNDGTQDTAHRQAEFAKFWNTSIAPYNHPRSLCPEIGQTSYTRTEDLATSELFKNPNYLPDQLMISASNNVDRIVSWVANWPIVLLAMVLTDIFRGIGNMVCNIANVVFSGISRRFIKAAIKDL